MTEMAGCEFGCQGKNIGGWDVPIVEFADDEVPISVLVMGTIENGTTDKKGSEKWEKLQDWKRSVATKVKAVRGNGPWDSSLRYAVSLGMRFNLKNHRNRKLDADNFTKPVFDAVAAGLFCDEDTNPQDIKRWGYEDSNFRTLLIHRFEDTPDPKSEGVAIHVSAI